MATVPMLAPNGSSGEIPIDKVAAAAQAGFKRAYEMTAPDGKTLGYIPQDKVQAAQTSGFTMAGKMAGTKVSGVNAKGEPIFTAADQPSTASLYGQALFNPVGSGAHAQGIVGGLEQAGGRAMSAAVAPVMHPLDTAKALLQSITEMGPFAPSLQPDGGPIANRVKEFQQEFKQSPSLAIENAAGDAAGAVEGGRLMGAAATKGAQVAAPVASRVALLGKTPADAYESALKPSTTLSQDERAAVVKTGLENEIPVSKQGLKDIGTAIENINQKVKDTIAADPNRPIDPNAVAMRADNARAKFANQVNARGDLDAIEASKQQFLSEQGGTAQSPAPPMGAAKAQAMKQGTYRVLAGKFGEQGSSAVEAQKDLARGLKEEIATQFPELSNLNANESKLLDLQPVLERAVNRTANHQLLGIGTPIAASTGTVITGSGGAGAVVGALKMVLDNPMVKSKLAIALSKGAKIPYAQALGRVAQYSSTLGSYAGATQPTSGDQTASQ